MKKETCRECRKSSKLNKKAQITVFIVLAVIAVALIAGYLFIKQQGLSFGKERINPEVAPVYNFIQECIKETGEFGLDYVGSKGGYALPINLSTEEYIAYYLYEGENYMPSKERIEQELAIYMNAVLYFCTEEFIDFPDFSVEYGEVQSLAKIEQDQVVFDVNYPISISKDNKTYEFEEFETIVPARLDLIYNVITEIMNKQVEKPDSICLSCLYEIADENNMVINFIESSNDNDTVIFIVTDEKTQIFDRNYTFYFANKYPGGDGVEENEE